ncbi:MAG: response regulator [Hyphomicrobiales bacterium]
MHEFELSDKHVLIIDDSRPFLSLMTDALHGFGIRKIIRSTDAIEAFEIIGRERIDLALVDYNMPLINGFEFANLVRCAPDSPNKFLPMILVTGHCSRRVVMESIENGFDDFLAKPLRAINLYQKITNLFENPKPYILTPSGYFGPDRRRREDPSNVHTERREKNQAITVGRKDLRLIHWVQNKVLSGNTEDVRQFWRESFEKAVDKQEADAELQAMAAKANSDPKAQKAEPADELQNAEV